MDHLLDPQPTQNAVDDNDHQERRHGEHHGGGYGNTRGAQDPDKNQIEKEFQDHIGQGDGHQKERPFNDDQDALQDIINGHGEETAGIPDQRL